MSKIRFTQFAKYLSLLLIVFFCFQVSPAQDKKKQEETDNKIVEKAKKGRLPVVIIPGLIGSELVNKETGDKVWFSLGRAKDDDMRLPISPNLKANKDKLVTGDILRGIQIIRFTPEIEIYKGLIKALEKDGYKEGKIDDAPADGFQDTFYVFPYDWRRDNVESAHLLLEKLDKIRAKTKRPKLKFNLIGHSMGGLVARYAAMYGKRDLSSRGMRPDWRGASYINNISMVATPNGGSLSALNSMVNGFSFLGTGKINLPFVRNLSKFDLFTIPSIYQLLPHENTIRVFDGSLQPIKVDIYDPKTWEKYGWLAYTDKDFAKEFTPAEQKQAARYFQIVLGRAKLFQKALNARSRGNIPVKMYYLGSDCSPTKDGMIVYFDEKDKKWRTLFEAKEYTKPDGTKATEEELKQVLYSPGDGVVSKRSLVSSLLQTRKEAKEKSNIKDLTVTCGEHNRLTNEKAIGESLLGVLNLSLDELTD